VYEKSNSGLQAIMKAKGCWCGATTALPSMPSLYCSFSSDSELEGNHYSLRPKVLECFDWNTNIKEFVRICEIAQLGFNPSLNKLFNELFYTQNRAFNKKI
jgi:hypothetical protein